MADGWERIASGMKFAEGPAWDGGRYLYASNCDGDAVTRVDLVTLEKTEPYRADAPGAVFRKTNGMTFGADGTLYACDFGRNAIVAFAPDGTQRVVVEGGFRGPNDLAFAPDGALWFTDPTGSGRDDPVGKVYRVVDGVATAEIEGMAFPNGLAFAADGKRLYVNESQTSSVQVFDLEDGRRATNRRLFARTTAPWEPDGMAFDAEGHLWIAPFGGDVIQAFGPDGKIAHEIPAPGRKCTNLEFCGEGLRDLVLTDADTNAIYRRRAPAPGLPLFHAPRPR